MKKFESSSKMEKSVGLTSAIGETSEEILRDGGKQREMLKCRMSFPNCVMLTWWF